MAQLNFDATQVAPDTGFDTVPAGWYNVKMDESEMKPTKDGSGAYLQCRFEILDGQYVGRKLFTRLNLQNQNPQAQEIAFKQLSAIAHAVGILHVQDSSQLHGIPLKAKVKIRKDKSGEYEDSNEITTYKNINEQVEMAGSAPAAGAPAAPPAGGFGQPPAAPPQQPPAQAPQPSAPPAWGQQPPAQPQTQPAPPPQAQPPQGQPPQQAAQPWAQPGQGAPAAQPPAQQQAPAQPPQQPAQQAAPQQPPQGATPPWSQPPQQ